jgi:hypothetical protein
MLLNSVPPSLPQFSHASQQSLSGHPLLPNSWPWLGQEQRQHPPQAGDPLPLDFSLDHTPLDDTNNPTGTTPAAQAATALQNIEALAWAH